MDTGHQEKKCINYRGHRLLLVVVGSVIMALGIVTPPTPNQIMVCVGLGMVFGIGMAEALDLLSEKRP